ncbi:MAG: T9SS type A sorting domain-containing protein, partial [Dysgonamonadaceae bacterium]|nr:T9SS type A sorting domain-containing protein [Dysgonamonadaceae bacterium]
AGKYVYDADRSSQATGATVTRSTTTSLLGAAAYQLKGTFTADDAYVTYKIAEPGTIVNSQQTIGLHVYGDLSGNELQVLFSNGTDVAVKLCDLNFIGWEFVETALSALPAEEDFTLTGIRVIRQEGILSKTLDICIDNMLLYNAPTGNSLPKTAAETIEIYPNPASETLFVKTGTAETPRLQLYSLSGILLKEVRANQIAVKDLSAGTYLLKVETEKGRFGRWVIIHPAI